MGLFPVKNPGALHRQLGVPEGDRIPVKKIQTAAKKDSLLGQRARAALAMRKITNHNK